MLSKALKINYNRLALWLLLLVFIGPWIAAHIIYVLRDNFTFKTLETGKFLSPPIQVQSLPFFDPSWLGKWQIIYVNPTNCDASCRTLILKLNQIHAALGKEKYRVEYRSVSVQETPIFTPDNIVIMDPKGWLILYYPSHTNPQGILKDMRRLLRYSHSG